MTNVSAARAEHLFVQWLEVEDRATANPALKFGHMLMEAGKISQATKHFESVLEAPASHFDLVGASLLSSKAHTLTSDFGVSFSYLDAVLQVIKSDVSQFRWIPSFYSASSFLSYMTGSPRSLPLALAASVVADSLGDKEAAARAALELVIMQAKFGVKAYMVMGELEEYVNEAMRGGAESLSIWRSAAEGTASLAQLPVSLREMVLSAAVKVYRGPATLLPPFGRLKAVTHILDRSSGLHLDLNKKLYLALDQAPTVDHRQILTF